MSMHNHFSSLSASQLAILDRIGVDDPDISRPFPRVPTDPAEYFRKWICIPAVLGQTEGTPDPSYFDLEAGYWEMRNRTNAITGMNKGATAEPQSGAAAYVTGASPATRSSVLSTGITCG